DMGDLRVRVGAPGNCERACPRTTEEKGVANNNARQRVGCVGKLVPGTNIARGKDSFVAGLQAIVDQDACALIVCNSGRFQVQTLDIDGAAGRRQDLINPELLSSAGPF